MLRKGETVDETRYRFVEQQLFTDAGVELSERWLDLPTAGTRARVLEVGEGRPVLFLSGGPMAAGTWAYVAAAATGIRCILLDRPGTGLSAALPVTPTPQTLPGYVSSLTADVLDALVLDRATVVGSSFGGYSALRSVIDLPDRIDGVVLAGYPAFVRPWRAPGFFTLLRAPMLGRLLLRLPATRRTSRMSLVQLGHRRSLAAGRIPEAMLAWTWAWQRHTDTMRNDADMIRRCGTWRGGFDRSLDLVDAELAAIRVPCCVLAGTDDPVGDRAAAQHLVDRLPEGSLTVYDGAGHLPWLDEPAAIAAAIVRFVDETDAARDRRR